MTALIAIETITAAKLFVPGGVQEIISKLDEAGKTFHILVLKTSLTIPYTSVFVRLECGYWGADAEKRLRAAMASH